MLTFTPVTEQDAIVIVVLRKIVWETTYRGIYPDAMLDQFDFDWHMERETQHIKSPQYREFFIENNGLPIGYIIIKKTTEGIVLESFYVIADYQRQGIGRKAFEFVKAYCRENGVTSFTLSCVPQNENARCFYEKMGGSVIGEDMQDEETWKNSVTYRFDTASHF